MGCSTECRAQLLFLVYGHLNDSFGLGRNLQIIQVIFIEAGSPSLKARSIWLSKTSQGPLAIFYPPGLSAGTLANFCSSRWTETVWLNCYQGWMRQRQGAFGLRELTLRS